MERTLIKNVGTLVTGDIGSPLAKPMRSLLRAPISVMSG